MKDLHAWNRAWRRLRMHKGRNGILILLLAVLTGSLVYCGLSVRYATERLEEINASVGNVLQVTKKDRDRPEAAADFSPREQDWFQENSGAKEWNWISESQALHMDLDPFIFDKLQYEQWKQVYEEKSAATGQEISDANCSVMGVTSTARLNLFTAGGFRLSEGSHIDGNNADGKKADEKNGRLPQALISQQLAGANNLSVGDTFDMQWEKLYRSMGYSQDRVTLQVAGIFQCKNPVGRSRAGNPARQWENQIFVEEGVLEEWFMTKPSILYLSMGDARNLPEQAGKLSELLTGENAPEFTGTYSVVWDQEWYEQVSTPFSQVIRILSALGALLGTGLLVMVVLLVKIFTMEKRKENWILYSMGERKRSIWLQTACETGILLMLALLVSLPGAIVAGEQGKHSLLAPYIQVCNETIENRQTSEYFYSQGQAANQTLVYLMENNPWFLMELMEE